MGMILNNKNQELNCQDLSRVELIYKEVKEMGREGNSPEEILESLTCKGYELEEIMNALI